MEQSELAHGELSTSLRGSRACGQLGLSFALPYLSFALTSCTTLHQVTGPLWASVFLSVKWGSQQPWEVMCISTHVTSSHAFLLGYSAPDTQPSFCLQAKGLCSHL